MEGINGEYPMLGATYTVRDGAYVRLLYEEEDLGEYEFTRVDEGDRKELPPERPPDDKASALRGLKSRNELPRRAGSSNFVACFRSPTTLFEGISLLVIARFIRDLDTLRHWQPQSTTEIRINKSNLILKSTIG